MTYLHMLVAALCVFVLISCTCRGDAVRMSEHKIGWCLMYLVGAAYAGGILIEVIEVRPLNSLSITALVFIALNLWLTKHLWGEGVPPSVKKDFAK